MPRHFFADDFKQLFFAVVFFDNLIINIRTVEAGNKFGRIVQVQIMLDVGAVAASAVAVRAMRGTFDSVRQACRAVGIRGGNRVPTG